MKKNLHIRWQLLLYDLVVLLAVELLLLVLSGESLSTLGVCIQILMTLLIVTFVRIGGNVYGQIWRYGGIQCYIRLLFTDSVAFVLNFAVERMLPIEHISFARMLAIASMNLLGALSIRMLYRYAFKCGTDNTRQGRFLLTVLRLFTGGKIVGERNRDATKISIAIVGAGRVGVSLAEELMTSEESAYSPRCFVDVNLEKVGRDIQGIPVLLDCEDTYKRMKAMDIQEVVFAIPGLDGEKKRRIYDCYKKAGYKLKVYDYPIMQTAGGKRNLREFDIEELLFRKPIVVNSEVTEAYYRNKVILITGGGGSIGSEMARQLARMQPKRLILLDIYENGVYDVQQELRMAYGGKLDVQIEILSITNLSALDRVFADCRPQIVINAAAHKHVPLMEHNCLEAVQNNVFGTQNVMVLCEKYHVKRFMMVSTDKAVNPTNVMGATKRLCEMMAQSAAAHGTVTYSVTRFGNVLGSAGSVIPLFRKQIARGGPVTLTDKRIIRYFMTIPEASQLVLESGAMAKNGELFVLDMGQPVRIYDLAESMIRLSGAQGIEIVETGLRPGEKLYEELLVKTEELTVTDNSLIFIERDTPLSEDAMNYALEILSAACETGDNEAVRLALHEAVPTYHTPEEVNQRAAQAAEMQRVRQTAAV